MSEVTPNTSGAGTRFHAAEQTRAGRGRAGAPSKSWETGSNWDDPLTAETAEKRGGAEVGDMTSLFDCVTEE
jgi:hypothetical protein